MGSNCSHHGHGGGDVGREALPGESEADDIHDRGTRERLRQRRDLGHRMRCQSSHKLERGAIKAGEPCVERVVTRLAPTRPAMIRSLRTRLSEPSLPQAATNPSIPRVSTSREAMSPTGSSEARKALPNLRCQRDAGTNARQRPTQITMLAS